LDFHKNSTESLLKRYERRIAFNLSSSRWGFASVLSTVFSFIIAFAVGSLALGLSLYAIKGNIMTWYVCAIVIFAILIGLAGCVGLALVVWISWYFIRVPLTKDSPTVESISKAVSEDIPRELRNINASIQGISNKMEIVCQRKKDKEK
jgi:hypothetical protein